MCFDCHSDVRAYDPTHPKGRKYTESELIGHRDTWYAKIRDSKGLEALNDIEMPSYSDDPAIREGLILLLRDTLGRLPTKEEVDQAFSKAHVITGTESVNFNDLKELGIDESFTGYSSYEASFQKVKKSMPELIKEMKKDLSEKGNEFIREFFIIGKSWILNTSEPYFCYFFEDHDNLQGKIHVLENYGFLIDVTPGNAKMYRMTEEFVDLLLTL